MLDRLNGSRGGKVAATAYIDEADSAPYSSDDALPQRRHDVERLHMIHAAAFGLDEVNGCHASSSISFHAGRCL